MEARRGGQILSRARGKRPRWKLSSADRERIDGFYRLAMAGEDQNLSALITLLRKQGAWDSTLLAITSDVSMGNSARVPFGDAERLEEDLLELPLVVHFPENRFGGKSVNAPTVSWDLMGTVLGALGLPAPEGYKGVDLYEVASSPERFALRTQFAVAGVSYSTRVGDLVLRGDSPRVPLLCDLGAGPQCTATPPSLAAQGTFLWRETYFQYRDSDFEKAATGREPATVDPDTYAALLVWGMQEK